MTDLRIDLRVPFRRRIIKITTDVLTWRTWIADYQPQFVDAQGRKWFSEHHRHANEFTFCSIGDAEAYLRRWRFNWKARVWA